MQWNRYMARKRRYCCLYKNLRYYLEMRRITWVQMFSMGALYSAKDPFFDLDAPPDIHVTK